MFWHVICQQSDGVNFDWKLCQSSCLVRMTSHSRNVFQKFTNIWIIMKTSFRYCEFAGSSRKELCFLDRMETNCIEASRRYGKLKHRLLLSKPKWGGSCRSNVTMCRIASKWDQIWLNRHRESWLATGSSKAFYHIRRCYGIHGLWYSCFT